MVVLPKYYREKKVTEIHSYKNVMLNDKNSINFHFLLRIQIITSGATLTQLVFGLILQGGSIRI